MITSAVLHFPAGDAGAAGAPARTVRSLATAAVLLGALLAAAHAQTPTQATASTSTAPAVSASPAPAGAAGSLEAPSPQVGDATRLLLARQAAGDWASPTPRPIAGEVAQRSYERYLKSFEFPIPQTFNSTVRSSSGSSGSGSSSPTP